jgi:hypothetical protein
VWLRNRRRKNLPLRCGGSGVTNDWIVTLCLVAGLVAILVLVAEFGWERWFRRKPHA